MIRIGPRPGPGAAAVRPRSKAGVAALAGGIVVVAGILAGLVLVAGAGLTIAPPAAATPAVVPPAAAGSAESTRGYTLSGREAVIHDLIGIVEIVPGPGPDIRVEVNTGGPGAGSLRVDTGRSGAESYLRVVFPGDRFVFPPMGRGSRTDCRVNDDGTFGEGIRGGRRVRISGGGEGLEARANLRIVVPDEALLKMYLGVGEVAVSRVNGRIAVSTMSGPVAAGGVRGTLDIDVGSGNVEVKDLTGELVIDTGSGTVSLAGVRGARADIDTGSGDVNGSDIATSDLRVDTGSGDIDITTLSSRSGTYDTGSGDVRLEVVADVDVLRIDTGSGDVQLRVPASLGATLQIGTGSGDIEIRVPNQSTRIDDGEYEGTIGNGAGRIAIDTGSGEVRILPG